MEGVTQFSFDPADESLGGVIKFIINKTLQRIDIQLPAKIVSYDRNKNLATVQPLIKLIATNGSTIEKPTISNIPVISLGGGGFNITFPLKNGDLGWIEASSRDISLFMQSKQIDKPNTLRVLDFADSKFIPDVFDNYTLPCGHDDKMIIQSTAGDTYLVIGDGVIKAKTKKAEIECNDFLIDSKNTTINANITNINSSVITANGAFTVNGNFNVKNGKAIINGIDFNQHGHESVKQGDQISGKAVGI